MRNVILAAVLAFTFGLSITGHAQQADGGAASVAPAVLTPDAAQAEIARLQAEVQRLRGELDNARQVRGNADQANTGTGGSGAADMEQMPVASATFEGRVSNVSKKAVEVIDRETGETYVLRVTRDTEAKRGKRRIPVTRISEGSQVRASFELVAGDTVATEIQVLRRGKR
jgi:hypothetical protein